MRGSIGVLGFKVPAKVREIGVFFLGGKKMVVKTVWVLKYAFPAQQKLCSENLHLFLHVEAIPTTKKTLVATYEF